MLIFRVTNSFSFGEWCYHWFHFTLLAEFISICNDTPKCASVRDRKQARSNNNFVDTQNNQNEIYGGEFCFSRVRGPKWKMI